jgi:hypothetical protein
MYCAPVIAVEEAGDGAAGGGDARCAVQRDAIAAFYEVAAWYDEMTIGRLGRGGGAIDGEVGGGPVAEIQHDRSV